MMSQAVIVNEDVDPDNWPGPHDGFNHFRDNQSFEYARKRALEKGAAKGKGIGKAAKGEREEPRSKRLRTEFCMDFYAYNYCEEGVFCKNVHLDAASRIISQRCRWYTMNDCYHGARCKYLHVLVSGEERAKLFRRYNKTMF